MLVNGAAARFARALLPRLCADASVDAVIGVDMAPVRYSHPKLRTERVDIRDGAFSALLPRCDALIHMDFVRPTSELNGEALFEINVRAAHKLFHAARSHGVSRLVHVSTAAVYGSAVHASEDAPLRPLAGFTYAEHQAQLEQLLAIDVPECVRLRPHVMVGANAHALVKLWLKQPFHARFADPEPLFQCVHEDDVAEAAIACLKNDARGPYNLAIDKSFTLYQALRERRRLTLPLPAGAGLRALELAARLTGTDGDRGWMVALTRTLLVNCRRAILDLDWKPRTLRAALRAI